MRRLSIAAVAFIAPLGGCVQQDPTTAFAPIPRPSPDDPTPMGISYICDGRKEVSVVYAKNRASVTFADKTWRMEYQAADQGFRYADTTVEWTGRDDLAALRESRGSTRPLAYNCRPTRRTT
jgi:Membrane-bound lysozyme-inhibitor of c-type lysozyme